MNFFEVNNYNLQNIQIYLVIELLNLNENLNTLKLRSDFEIIYESQTSNI